MNAVALTCWALATVILGACSSGDGLLLPSEGEPAAIAVVRGDSQSARVREPLAKPVVVEVTDSRDRPVEGATVTFELTSAGPEADIAPHTATTDANGQANAQVVLGTTVGRQVGSARVTVGTGTRTPEASFTAMALSENANTMAAVAGEDQTGHVGSPLDDRLVIQVTDSFGNPIAGVPIAWSAQGGGTVSAAIVNTDDQGRASVERILGPTAGQQATTAASEGLSGSPVTFLHAALAGNATRLAIISGDAQTGQVGVQLPAELVVRLIDADGNGVPGAVVTWGVPIGGGSVTPGNSVTDGDGRASARWTLGSTPGANRVDAAVSGVGVASFNATGTAGAPAVLSIVTQPSSSARNGIRLDRQPVIQLRDAGGNAVAQAGVQISAALGSGSGDLTGTRQHVTDANGQATFTDLAIGGSAGQYTLVFSSAGYASATSSAIDLRSIPTVTTITSDSPDPTAPGAVFTVEFRVSSEGPTPDGTVSVSDDVQSCSGTLSGGAGSCQLALSTSGDRTLRATYAGGTGLDASSDTETHRVETPPPDNRAPTADYNWHCDGLTCQFTDHSSDPDGSIASRTWNFGDGSGAISETDPTHTFPASGSYTVTLTVTDNGGATDDASAGVSVQAPPPNQSPTAAFSADCKELECKFNSDGSNDPDGRIAGYAWNFGDNTSSNEKSPKHDYAVGGSYTVTLVVTDNAGATGQVSSGITVSVPNKAPHAEFEVQCTNLDCSFTDKSSDEDGSIAGWQWDFGDGQGSNLQSPSHSYSVPGNYQVGLTVTDNGGATASRTHTAEAKAPANQPPTAQDDGVYTTSEDVVLHQTGLLTNDSDPEGSPLTAELVSNPAHGQVSLQTDGSFDYTPDANYFGGDSFTYRAKDAQGAASNAAIVSISVSAVNDQPVATNDQYTTSQDVVLNVGSPGVLANDTDPDGDNLTAQVVSPASNGTVALNSDGSFTYTPNSGFIGSDAFTYSASDGQLASQATVTLNVQASTPPPPEGSSRLGLRTPPPSRVTSGTRLRPEPEVQLLDPTGKELALGRVSVSVSLSGPGQLTGNLIRNTDQRGRAKFNDLSITSTPGSSVALSFAADRFQAVTTQAILVE
jgi:VCBS repeat-containing protein